MSNQIGRVPLALVAGISLAFTSHASADDPLTQAKVVQLDQGWTPEDRLRYYFTSQGSAALSYDIFLHLETAKGQELFRTDKNLAGYGLVPFPAAPKFNPDGLPIGITKTAVPDGQWKGEWVGMTCAACHNGRVEYKGTTVNISGGNSAALDVHTFIIGLDEALTATVDDPKKFDRLADKVGQRDRAGKETLRKRLQADAAQVHRYRDVLALTPTTVGPGRMDALRLIHNQVQSRWLGVPENWVAPLAPVKPSFCWNIPQSSWAQWSGVLKDPLLRNQGQALGVFARLDLTSKTPQEGLFDSTVDLKGLIEIEKLLARLAPPPWPEEVLGKIDREKAARGAKLFAENCSECHSSWPHRWSEPKKQGKRFIENAIVPQAVVGTDRMQLTSPQFQTIPTVKAGPLSQHLPPPFTGAGLAPPPVVFGAVMRGVSDRLATRFKFSDDELLAAHNFRAVYPEPVEPPPSLVAYKANPIEGMWASPPFLHNGSVPNLFELLGPARDRSKKFFLGRDFDPVKVGVDTSGDSGKFLFDTSLVGNSNAGHSFEDGPRGNGVIGRRLTDDERWALIEFVKSVPSQPAQVAPIGGPKEPVRAWADATFFHVKNPGTYNGAPEVPAVNAGRETLEPNEKETIEFLKKATLDRLRKQYPPGERVLRDAHPKAHGLVTAEFIVLDALPEELRHGVFKTPRTFDALIRFSAGNVEVQPDTTPQAAGMAIKLLGVEGEKLLEGEKNARTQDFVMINFPGFFVRNLAEYELLHKDLEKGRLEEFFKTRPEEAKTIVAMRTQPFFSPVQVPYFSQTPYLLGPNAIKFSAAPISRTTNRKPEKVGPDFLREVMAKQVGAEDVYFDFLVQLQTEPAKMPVEDPVVIWDEAKSPFRRAALIRIPKQDITAKGRQELAENLAFTPWHSLPEHRPLGGINRARRVIYEAVSEFRRKTNDVPREEPKELPQ